MSHRKVTKENLRSYLAGLKHKDASTYTNHLACLKRFYRDYLEMPDLVKSFRFPRKYFKPRIIPNKTQVQQFYKCLEKGLQEAQFLTFATSGLRKSELLGLEITDVDLTKNMIVPRRSNNSSKNVWVTFFNHEAEEKVRELVEHVASNKLFNISGKGFKKMWIRARNKSGTKITPQVLRDWFCVEMGELGVPDRYVDAFCGRVPKSIPARHYTDYSPQRLKRIYDKAGLTVLS
jgi:integrase